jgi:predicted PurR-regulated permease PerM
MIANGLTGTDTHTLVKRVGAAILAALIVATLYFGRDVFVPVALSILLSFVLAPLVRALQDFRVPRAISVPGVVLLAFSIIFVIGGVIATQMTQLAGELPRYESNMRAKIQSLRGTAAANNPLEHAADVLQDLGKELNKPKEPSSARTPAANSLPGQDARPIPVEVRQPPPTALESIAALISPLLHPLMTSGIVIIFVIFTLLQREDLRNRLIKLAGSHDLQKTTAALNDAAQRLSRLFLSQLALNSAFGLVIGTGLWFIGVPSAVLWGILAGILRFVPYIGVFIAAIFPLALAIAVDPGWSLLIWTAALFAIFEPLVGQVIEPLFYGHSTGLSPLALVVSATFWTALWGPIGLVLATPLTICLVVLGRHVENLKFLEVMFGDRPALSPPELFYQRMLAEDPAEALDNAEQFLKEKSLAAYYDEVALKGLKLAQADLDRNALDALHLQRIRDSVIELVKELDDYEDQTPKDATHNVEAKAAVNSSVDPRVYDLPVLAKDRLATHWRGPAPVLCIAGRTGLDEAAANMLAQILSKHGIGARVESVDALSSANIFRRETTGIAMVCLSFLNTSSIAQMRFMIRRLRRKLPDAMIVLGSWYAEADPMVLADAVKADGVALTLHDAAKVCVEAASADAVDTKVEVNNNDSSDKVVQAALGADLSHKGREGSGNRRIGEALNQVSTVL